MNGSPEAVLSFGFGSWGSVGLVITLGFGVGAEPVVTARATEYRILHGADNGFTRISGTDNGFKEVRGTETAFREVK